MMYLLDQWSARPTRNKKKIMLVGISDIYYTEKRRNLFQPCSLQILQTSVYKDYDKQSSQNGEDKNVCFG